MVWWNIYLNDNKSKWRTIESTWLEEFTLTYISHVTMLVRFIIFVYSALFLYGVPKLPLDDISTIFKQLILKLLKIFRNWITWWIGQSTLFVEFNLTHLYWIPLKNIRHRIDGRNAKKNGIVLLHLKRLYFWKQEKSRINPIWSLMSFL